MRRHSCIFMLSITAALVLSVNIIAPNQALFVPSTVSAASQAQPIVNLASGKSATQISTNGNHTADLAIDRATGTFSQTLSEVHPWWEVDLGAIGLIDNVKVINPTGCCDGGPKSYYALVSDVPFGTHNLEATRNLPQVTSHSILAGTIQAGVGFKRTGRYVRVQAQENVNQALGLADVQVNGNTLSIAANIVGKWAAPLPDLHDGNSSGAAALSLVHISVLPNRKLLFCSRDKKGGTSTEDDVENTCKTWLWDLSTTDNTSTIQDDRLTLISNTTTNLFCSGTLFPAQWGFVRRRRI